MRKPLQRTRALAKSSVLTSGRTLRCTRSPLTVGVKFRRTPNSLNWTDTADVGARALRDGNRELAAGEEAGFLAAFGHQVRLGQALEQPAVLHRLDHHAQVVLLAEEEQVQEVAELELALGRRDAPPRNRCWPSSTPGRRSPAPGTAASSTRPSVFLMPVGPVKKSHAELGQRAAADFGEPHAQQHLVAGRPGCEPAAA